MLARVRLPGGLVDAAQLRVLARLADELGDGRIELTSRGNVQLRGLAADAASPLTSELVQAGLLPSLSHDQVRNVLASPLAGLDRGTDLTGIVRALDAALCARPRLAELSGRFLFAIDDGRGDVAGLGADVVATVRPDGAIVNGLAVCPGSRARNAAGARPGTAGAGTASPGPAGPVSQVTGSQGVGTYGLDANQGIPDDRRDRLVAAMLAFAEAFLDQRAELGSAAWRISDLPGGAERVRDAVSARLGLDARPGPQPWAGNATRPGPVPVRQAGNPAVAETDLTGRPGEGGLTRAAATPVTGGGQARDALAEIAGRPVGFVTSGKTGDGGEPAGSVRATSGCSVVLVAPLGRLTSAQVRWVADRLAGREARITPWRSVVLPDLEDAAGVLRAAAGLGFGTDEGSPWLRVTACAGRPGCASALADVQADAAGFAARWPGRIVHVSGCGRHCGRPAATEIDVTATSEGYQVAGV